MSLVLFTAAWRSITGRRLPRVFEYNHAIVTDRAMT
jgi:hypothetical protein